MKAINQQDESRPLQTCPNCGNLFRFPPGEEQRKKCAWCEPLLAPQGDAASPAANCVLCGHRATLNGLCEVGIPDRGKDRYGYNIKCGCRCEFPTTQQGTEVPAEPPADSHHHGHSVRRLVDRSKTKD